EKKPVTGFFSEANGLSYFAKRDAREFAHHDILTQTGAVFFDVFANGLVRVLDERLVQQAALGKVLAQLAFNDLLSHFSRLTFEGVAAEKLLFLGFAGFGRDVVSRNVFRIARRDVHGDVFDQVGKDLVAGNEVSLAVDLDQHADATVVVVGADDTLAGFTLT